MNLERYEPDYATSLSNHANYLTDAGQNDEALKLSQQALEMREQLAKMNPDRHEPDYASSLNNHAGHLSDAGQNDEALRYSQQALKIRERLAKMNPDRHESDYATSLSNHANYLSDAGQNDEALKLGQQALEMREQLAKMNPDRYESDYAMSLSNHANYLSDAGQNADALKHSQKALEIRERLAAKWPSRFNEDLFSNTCSVYLINWLHDPNGWTSRQTSLDPIPLTIQLHRRQLLLLYTAFMRACVATDPIVRAEDFKQVLAIWSDLSLANKNSAQAYWLCAAAWCAAFAPEAVADLNWQADWHKFSKQRQGQIPQWMHEVARRMVFQWPA